MHTPGPWEAEINDKTKTSLDRTCLVRGYHNNEAFAVALCDEALYVPWEQQSANARLIAAAPELLAALEAAEPILAMIAEAESKIGLEPTTEDRERLAKARAAIAKAKP